MAAVSILRTVKRPLDFGNVRAYVYTVSVTTTGDTLTLPLGLRIKHVIANASSTTFVGTSYTAGGNTVTFNFSGGGGPWQIDVMVLVFN